MIDRIRIALSLLIVVAAASFSAPSVRAQDLPTTVEAWEQLIGQLEQADDPISRMLLSQITSFKDAFPLFSDEIKQKLRGGGALTLEEANELRDAVTAVIKATNPDATVNEDPLGADDLASFNAFSQAAYKKYAAALGEAAAPDAAPAPAPAPADAAAAPAAAEDVKKGMQLWEDYIHYSRIARLDLTISSGTAFSALGLAPQQLLDVIEAGPYENWDRDLIRMQRMEGPIAELAKKIEDQIIAARLALARDQVRVRQAIERLDDGLRARIRATDQLKVAGQYAAPELLKVLLSRTEEDAALRPLAIETMVVIGRPIVPPLCEALGELPPVAQQQVAEVLARIGYPMALPYLRDLADRSDVNPEVKSTVEVAYSRLTERAGVPAGVSAAQLYLAMAEDYYAGNTSMVLEPKEATNLLWSYDATAGMTYVQVPTPVFGDVQAMRATRRALQLQGDLSAAFSLWVAANLRRENNLPAGSRDPSYSATMKSPMFYAELSGPSHMHPVLARAMRDRDATLALDAIAAISHTAGPGQLLNLDGEAQPIIAGMAYPDRRVRIESALALARSKPTEPFDASTRVVPVLSDAIRQAGQLYALVLADDVDTINAVSSLVRAAGNFQVLFGSSVEETAEQVNLVPGIDLVVVHSSAAGLQEHVFAVRQQYKLAGAPLVLLAPQAEVGRLARLYQADPLLTAVDQATEGAAVGELFKQVTARHDGDQLTAEQAQDYALRALAVLRDMAVDTGEQRVFNLLDAKPALLAALNDPREPVVLATAQVLALIGLDDVQQALADAALQAKRGATMQVALFNSLAQSARLHGNKLSNAQVGDIIKTIEESTGDLADAAAGAHGALNLPTAKGVDLITK